MLNIVRIILRWTNKTIRRLVSGWRLEHKSLLFFGVALLIPIGLAFWFVLEVVAQGLALRTLRQKASDHVDKVVLWQHTASTQLDLPTLYSKEVMQLLRDDLIKNPDYHHQYLMLEQTDQYRSLNRSELPSVGKEMEKVQQLADEYRAYYVARDAEAALADPNTALNAASADGSEGQDDEKPLLFRDFDDPYFEPADNPLWKDRVQPPEGWYVYYKAVHFDDRCITCHGRHDESTADLRPFRAVKVMIPYSQKAVASTSTVAILIAIAMVTIAATLVVVHWVMRQLVLRPLTHLKTVSEAIGSGKTDLRASIDTGDEFNELADSFNQMLRHMTEGQSKLRRLNNELDVRVDQLAQANLNLFEANRLKSDFLANMSHELRTPLNSIIGFSEVLGDIPALNEKQRKYAGNIQSSGKLLLEMINDILDLAKVEAGKMTVTPTSFNLNMLVEAQCDMLRSLVDDKNMDMQLITKEDSLEVFQDQPKIQQVLTNLLSNAIKFTPDGGIVTVTVGFFDNETFFVEVSDTGVGIPEEDFGVIFEKFRQSNEVLKNGGLTRNHSGTGLGLSIVKELCKLLGGEVRLASQLGTGSQFTIILPVHFEATQINQLEQMQREATGIGDYRS